MLVKVVYHDREVEDKEFKGVRMLTVYPQAEAGASPEIVFHNEKGSHWEKLENIFTITLIEEVK